MSAVFWHCVPQRPQKTYDGAMHADCIGQRHDHAQHPLRDSQERRAGLEAGWKCVGGKLEASWRRAGGGLEMVWRCAGGGELVVGWCKLEAGWRCPGGRLEAGCERAGGELEVKGAGCALFTL